MKLIQIPQLLIIAGNGRNSGKTTLACRLITRFCKLMPVVSVKISPHDYQASYSEVQEGGGAKFFIMEEKDILSSKDSSRMLAAGANRSLFVCAADDGLELVLPTINQLAANGNCIICESGGLRNFVEPGLFLVVQHIANLKAEKDLKPGLRKLMDYEHTRMTFDGQEFNPGIDSIFVKNGIWKIKPI